jgi:hypothetical protein
MAVYGGPGLKKTFAIHSCPFPIRLHDFDKGTGPLIPWVRRRRNWHDSNWLQLTQADRQVAYDMLPVELQREATIRPNPLIDIISYDVFSAESYNHFIMNIGNLDPQYNTEAVDSLQEFSIEVQSFSKGGGTAALEPISNALLWGPIQERTAIALRRLRSYRDSGIFVYMTGSEVIDKDYVTDPRASRRGAQPEEAYSIKGTINLPGKMAGTVPHLVDVLAHARSLNGTTQFVTQHEPLPGGAATWEAKDRFGRLDKYMQPNVRAFFEKIYGEAIARVIYKAGVHREGGEATSPPLAPTEGGAAATDANSSNNITIKS